MNSHSIHRFTKSERLCSKKQIDKLFAGGQTKSMSAWPVRLVCHVGRRQATDAPVQVLVSVSKRHFKHAVDRNRVKRQLREAYRLNNNSLHEALQNTPDNSLLIALIWMADEHKTSAEIGSKVKGLLQRLTETLKITSTQKIL